MIRQTFLLLSFSVSISCTYTNPVKDKLPEQYIQQLDSLNKMAAEGDIIFRGGTDIESAVIRDFSIHDKLFSHSGIILHTNEGLRVYHILGGSTNIGGSILKESIDSFIVYPQNESAGLYHVNLNSKQIDSLKYFIDSLISKKTTFDIKFNLYTKETSYCTEMLIGAIKYCTQQKVKFETTNFLVKNTKYHFLMNWKDSFQYYPIDQFQQNILLSKKRHFLFPNYYNGK